MDDDSRSKISAKGGGIMVLRNFEYTAEMCDCRYCPYYRGKRKWTADNCPCKNEYLPEQQADPRP